MMNQQNQMEGLMADKEISSPQLRKPSNLSVISTGNLEFAAERAGVMIGCFRKGDANDPKIYASAIIAILSEYPEDVIRRVTDPRTGIPRQLKFLPNPAEIAEACDNAVIFLKAERALARQGYEWNGERYAKKEGV